MKIDKNKLVELLVEKTNMDKKKIEAQLDQLTERILDAANRGKALEIKEFGLFFFDQNSELKFEPSDELTTEISFKYAGMKPVEMKPERDANIPAEIETFIPTDDENNVKVISKSTQDKSTEPKKETPNKDPQKKSTPIKPSAVRNKSLPRKRDNSLLWGFLAFLGVLLIGAWIYYMQPAEPIPVAETETEISPEQPISDMDTEGNDPEIDQSTDDLPENTEPDPPAEEQSEPDDVELEMESELYGLTGDWVNDVNNAYSIVIHSFYREQRANEVAANYINDGYRTMVTSRVVNDLDVYRVSLGQFESIEDAQNSAKTLPEPFNTENFIQRIQ
ncbi:MAG: SPOR domain-containing protein [Balneolaceae bacterium]